MARPYDTRLFRRPLHKPVPTSDALAKTNDGGARVFGAKSDAWVKQIGASANLTLVQAPVGRQPLCSEQQNKPKSKRG